MSVISQIISELRNDANGAAVLEDWLGAGGEPVPLHQAELRSGQCLYGAPNGTRCPHNRAPKWWERFFKDPIAQAIKRHIEVKQQIGLKLSKEDDLHMCARCGCCLQLKTWVPIEHIKAHHKPEHLYPDWCWIKREMET